MRFLLILCIVINITACDNPPPASIRFGLSNAPVTLDPRFATDAASVRANRLLYCSLVKFDDNLLPIPNLATWENVDLTHYRFHLGQTGRQFHNGHFLTAYDVKATYDFILKGEPKSPHRAKLNMIQAVNVQDEDTLEFVLTKPDTLFPSRLEHGILPKSLIDQNHPFHTHPLGSGAFKFVDWPQSNHLRLQRLSDGQVVEFIEVKDPVVRALKLARGELDLLQNDLSPELITWLEKQSELYVRKRKGSNFTYIGFNLKDDATKQLTIRRAIAYAINREEIIRYVMGDAARPASGFFPPTHWVGNSNLGSYDYDPEKAKHLLASVGVSKDKPIYLTYKTTNNPLRIRIATVIQHQLAKVNIHIDIRTYDWGTFYGDIKKGRFQMYSLSWVGITTPDIFRYVFHSDSLPPGGANRGRWESRRADLLIEQAEAALTLKAQTIFYRELQAYVLEQLPYVPLWYEDHVLVANHRIHGYELAADGNYDGLIQVERVVQKKVH